MLNLQEVNYFSPTNRKIQCLSIEDKLFQQFSQNVRLLSRALQDWIELSIDWDFALGKLRTADWLLRNDPTPLWDGHRTVIELSEGLSVLSGLHKNMSPDIQALCSHIIASGDKIIKTKLSNLNIALERLLFDTESGSKKNALVLRQENIRFASELWIRDIELHEWECFTSQQIVHSGEFFSNLVVVGLTQDYPINVFNSIYPENRFITLSHSWIKEQKTINGFFSDIAEVVIDIEIEVVHESGGTNSAQEVAEDFLEPSAAIDVRRLSDAAKRVLKQIENTMDEELVQCKAYLLGSGELVFLPTGNGSIDALDPIAPKGEKVQRVPISNLTTNSILLLRVGTSEGDAIVNMANELGGALAKDARMLQSAWKNRLKERMKSLGIQRVTSDLQGLGIANPWLGEWSHSGNIRPNSLTNFTLLLEYLDLEPKATIEAMNTLRHLHQLAGMRFRSILKKKFEIQELGAIFSDGFVIVNLGEEAGVADLGAYLCKSIGTEVFDVPESAVKQLQPGKIS